MYPKIISISPNDDYTLLVTFSDKKTKLYDMNPLLQKSPFDQLKDKNLFFKQMGLAYNLILKLFAVLSSFAIIFGAE